MNFFKILTIKGKKHCFVDFLRIFFFGLATRPSLACLQEHRGLRVVFRRIKREQKNDQKSRVTTEIYFFGEEKVKISKSF